MKALKIIISIGIIMLVSNLLNAQNLKTEFSKETILKGKNKGYTNSILTESDGQLYVLMTIKKNKVIQAVNKQDLSNGKRVSLKAKGSSWYWTVKRLRSGLLVLYIDKNKEDSKKRDVYGTMYDWGLNPVYSNKKITTYDPDVEDINIERQNGGDNIAVVRQKYVEEGENIVLEYQVFDKELEFVSLGQQTLDLVSKISLKRAKRRNSTVVYKFNYTSGNELVAPLFVKKDDDPRGAYFLTFIDVKEDKLRSEKIELEDAFFEYLYMNIEEDELMVAGFYSNSAEKSKLLSKKTKTVNTSGMDGTFFRRYNTKSRKLIASQQTPFSDEMLYRINNSNPAMKRTIKKNKKKGNTDDDISDSYRIRKVIYDGKTKTATFFCEYMNNYSVTTTTRTQSGTTTTTTYYSIRGNLFYFDMSLENGQIDRVNSIRKYQYLSSSSPSIYNYVSMRVVRKENTDLVLYFTDRLYNEREKDDLSGEKFKTKGLKQDFIAAEVDRNTGNYSLELPRMSNKKLKSWQKVQFRSVLNSDADNAFYSINRGYKFNVPYGIVCAVIPGLGWVVWALTPGTRSHEVYTIAKMNL